MIKLKLWREYTHFRNVWVSPCWGTRWIFNYLNKVQVVDNLHHAPACNANHWHKTRLVFDYCNCGAVFLIQTTKDEK